MTNLTVSEKVVNPPPDSHNKQNEPTQAKTIGFAIAIIVGIGGLAVAGVGIGGYLGAISSLDQINSIIMIAAGGGGGILFLIVGIVGTVKNHSQKKMPPETNTKKEVKNDTTPPKTENVTTVPKPVTSKEKEKEPEKANGPEKTTSTSATPKQKELFFSDKSAKLYDRTSAKVVRDRPVEVAEVKVRPFQAICPLAATRGQPHDVILLHLGIKTHFPQPHRMVLFARDLGTVLTFSKAANTDHVIVEDAEQPGVYNITKVQTNGAPDNHWVVDTKKKFYIIAKTDAGQREETPVCLIESEIPKGYADLHSGAMISQYVSGDMTRTLYKGA